MSKIGERIKRLRESKNYTQDYLASKIGMSQNAYSKMETGGSKITVERLEKIAEVLDIPIDELLTEEQKVFNFDNNDIAIGYIEHLQYENKESAKMLHGQIEFQQKEIDRLLNMIELLISKI
jgi:transcriptional regulator with XRE-family HTH domain